MLFKWPKKIDSLDGNIAFWLFLIICVIAILYIIGINILTLGSLRKVSIRKGLVNDEIYYKFPRVSNGSENDSNSNDETLKKEKRINLNLNLKIVKFQVMIMIMIL